MAVSERISAHTPTHTDALWALQKVPIRPSRFLEMLPDPAVRYYPANGRALFYHSYGQVLSFSVSWGPSDSAVRLIGNGETAG